MKALQYILLAIVYSIIASIPVQAASVSKVVGMNGDATTPPPPAGICTGTYAMSSVGILLFTELTSFQELGVGPTEQSNDGFEYFSVRSATFGTTTYKINNAFAVDTSIVIDIADNPDDTASLAGSHYNTFEGEWVVTGRQLVAPCGAGANCVHVRAYAGNAIVSDVVTGVTTNGRTFAGSTFDEVATYIQYDTAGGVVLGKFSTSAYALLSSDIVGAANALGLTNDTSFVYGVIALTGVVKRWDKSNIAGGETNFSPGFTTPTIRFPIFDTNGNLYIGGRSAGVSPNIMYKVRTSDMTIQGSVSFANTDFIDKILVDELNDKIYVIITQGTNVVIKRVNRTTLVVEETFSGTSTPSSITEGMAQIDVLHQDIYVPFNGSGATVSRIQKVNLCNP